MQLKIINCGPFRKVPPEYPVKVLKYTKGIQNRRFLKTLQINRLMDFNAKDLPCQSISLLTSSNLLILKSLIEAQILVSGASMPKLTCD